MTKTNLPYTSSAADMRTARDPSPAIDNIKNELLAVPSLVLVHAALPLERLATELALVLERHRVLYLRRRHCQQLPRHPHRP